MTTEATPEATPEVIAKSIETASAGDNTGGGTGNNGSGWVDSDGNVFSSPQDVYVGGGQSYQPPQSTAPSAALYDTKDKKVDDKTLSSNDWGDIAAKLKILVYISASNILHHRGFVINKFFFSFGKQIPCRNA